MLDFSESSLKNRTLVVSFPSLFSAWISFGKGGGVLLVGFIAEAFLVGSLIQRGHSWYRDDRVGQCSFSLSLLVSKGKSARLLPEAKRDSSEFRVAEQQLSRGTRNARFPCMPSTRTPPPSIPLPPPLMRSQFRFAGINPNPLEEEIVSIRSSILPFV